MKKWVDFFFYSNLYAVVLITALIYQSFLLNGVPFSWTPEVAVLVCGTLFVYPFHRVNGLKSIPDASKMERHYFAQNHSVFIYGLSLVGLIGAGYYTLQLSLNDWLLLIPVGFISVAYILPIVPQNGKWIKIRELPYLKVFFIAVVVAYLTVVFPLQKNIDWKGLTFLAFSRSLFLIAITIPFDIRDYGIDKLQGIQTLPVKFGIEKSKSIAVFINIFFTLFSFVQFFSLGLISLAVFFAFWISETYADVFIKKADPTKSEHWFSIYVEGAILVQTALVVLAIWVYG